MFTTVISKAPEATCARIRAEYGEMPGLVLTRAQAQRLWRLSPAECDAALATLISEGFLIYTRHVYVRASADR